MAARLHQALRSHGAIDAAAHRYGDTLASRRTLCLHGGSSPSAATAAVGGFGDRFAALAQLLDLVFEPLQALA